MKSAIILTLLFYACTPIDEQPPEASTAVGLKKISINSASDLEKLQASGVEIIILEEKYAIIRVVNSVAVSAFTLQTFDESELVQRLIKITLTDSLGVQPIVDNGLDLWGVEDGKAIARAFDYHIEKLRKMGYQVEITAKDASIRGEQK